MRDRPSRSLILSRLKSKSDVETENEDHMQSSLIHDHFSNQCEKLAENGGLLVALDALGVFGIWNGGGPKLGK